MIIGTILTVLLFSGFVPFFGSSSRGVFTNSDSSISPTNGNSKIAHEIWLACESTPSSSTPSCSATGEFPSVQSGDVVVVALNVCCYPPSSLSLGDSLFSSYSVAVFTHDPDDANYLYIFLATLKKSGTDTLTLKSTVNPGNVICQNSPSPCLVMGAAAYEVSGVTTSRNGTGTGLGSCNYSVPTDCPIFTSTNVAFKQGAFLLAIASTVNLAFSSFSPGSGFTLDGNVDVITAEYSTSGLLSPTNFPATFKDAYAPNGPSYWIDLGVALEPKPSATPLAGYFGTVSSGQLITNATARWNLASVSCDKSLSMNQSFYTFLQIGDARTSEAIGTLAYCARGAASPTYSALALFTPTDASPVVLSLPIKAGDEVRVSIAVLMSTDTVTATVTDLTSKASATHSEVVSGTSPFYAEWLVSKGGGALAKFSTAVKFQNCGAVVSGKSISISQFAMIIKFKMTDKNGKSLAVTSSLSPTGRGFSVVWKGYQ